MTFLVPRKIWPAMQNDRILRTSMLLIALMLVASVSFGILGFSYGSKIGANQVEIQKNEAYYENLEKIAAEAGKQASQKSLFESKSFANFDEVIPFIAFLEGLFSAVDSGAQITIKSQEGQIYIDHFADYSLSLKLNNKTKELFWLAVDELYNSRFMVKPLNFMIYYSPAGEDMDNEIHEVIMVIRLYLK